MRTTSGKIVSRRNKARLARWAGLLALAGLLAMATVPGGHRPSIEHITADQGASIWRG